MTLAIQFTLNNRGLIDRSVRSFFSVNRMTAIRMIGHCMIEMIDHRPIKNCKSYNLKS
jgi:hypothetical protein